MLQRNSAAKVATAPWHLGPGLVAAAARHWRRSCQGTGVCRLDKFTQVKSVMLLSHESLLVCSQVCLVLATCKAADITTEQIGSTDRLSNL